MTERELRTLNQPRLGPPEDPGRLVRCRVVGGVDHIYSWMCAGRSVQLGDIVLLPHVDAMAFEKIGRVRIV